MVDFDVVVENVSCDSYDGGLVLSSTIVSATGIGFPLSDALVFTKHHGTA